MLGKEIRKEEEEEGEGGEVRGEEGWGVGGKEQEQEGGRKISKCGIIFFSKYASCPG